MNYHNTINGLLFTGMTDKKLISKITPFVNLSFLKSIFLIRNNLLQLDKVVSCSTPKILNESVLLRESYRFSKSIQIMMLYKIDFVYGIYLTMHGIYAFILGKIFNKPIIQNIIGSDTPKILKSKLLQKILINSDIIIVRGTEARNEFVKFGVSNHRIFNIPNHFEFPDIEINAHEKKYDLVFVGALNRVKRIDILISAIEVIKTKHNLKISVCLVGDGELRTRYENLIRDKGLDIQFELVGNQSKVEDYLIQSKVFIMTSEFEGLPQAMLEALACGLPVIMPNISNIPDYAIDGYNALLIEPLDVDGFADAIYKLMTDDELYRKLKSGAEKFREEHAYEFSMENITNIWNQIFNQLGLIKEENAQ